ncbi:MAG: SHOCT domain-containing protein [Pseudomonadota bacterium]
MQKLSQEGERIVNDVAARHGFSFDAVATMLQAVSAGGGTQAQFNHFEFGGMGQWSLGGMIMIGDMFNNNLKYRVEGLCSDLSGILANNAVYQAPAPMQSQQQSQGGGGMQQQGGSFQSQGSGDFGMASSSLFVPGPGSAQWWPTDLGAPSSTGAQNNLRYAVFPAARRLAIDNNGTVKLYDLGDHQIGGFSQQQSGDQSITFTSQFGTVRVADLPVVSPQGGSNFVTGGDASDSQPTLQTMQPANADQQFASDTQSNTPAPDYEPPAHERAGVSSETDDIIATIERLAGLRDKEIISADEFESKKQELLSRL